MGGDNFFLSKISKKDILGLVHLGDHVLQGICNNGVKLEL